MHGQPPGSATRRAGCFSSHHPTVQMQRLLPFADLVARVERLAGGAPATVAVPMSAVAPAATPVPAAARTPAPPAPYPPAPVSGADGILKAMVAQAQTRPTLAQPLRSATAREEGDALVLEVAADFYGMAASHAEEYRELARKASGRPLKVKIAAASAAATAAEEAPVPAADGKKEKLLEEAAREPAVQEALDLFGGRVVDVRETKG